jgi:hypothetical protein
MVGWQQCPRKCIRDLLEPQNLVVFSIWLIQAVTLSRSTWWQVCGCMRDSTWDKPRPKWWLCSENGLIRHHHEEWHCWIRKNECSLLEVLKTGRDRNVVFWSKENPNFTQEMEHNPPHVMIRTCNQGLHKWFKSNYGSILVGKKLSKCKQSPHNWWFEDGHHRLHLECRLCYTKHGLREHSSACQ